MGRGPGVRIIGRSIQVDFRYKGIRCRERLRLEPNARNLRYAKNLKARIEHEIATGSFDYARHFPTSRRTADRSAKLKHCLERFLVGVRVSPETLEEYTDSVGLVPAWLSEMSISAIKQSDIEGWIDGLDVSRKRINNLLIPIRGAFRKAHRDGEIKSNPLIGLKTTARKTESQIDPFTREEVDSLSRVYCGRIWRFWAWTGLRSGEIAGLEWRDVDCESHTISVRRSVRSGREKLPKTRSGYRVVRVLDPAWDVLGSGLEGPVFVNPVTGTRFDTDRQLRTAFGRACEEAGVRYRYCYMLRHTFASVALSSGENPLWVAKQMGHKDVSMVLRVYGRYIPEMDPLAGTRMVK